MVFDPKRNTIQRVLETSEPLDSVDSIPESAVMAEMPQEKDEETDSMETPDASDKDSTAEYIYYSSNGKIIKENINDPDDKQVMDIPGATSPKVDTKNDAIYYIIFDKNIVRESPIGSNNREYLIRESGKLNSLSYDPKRNILVFANSDAGTIEAYNINTKGRFVFYRGLDSPKKLTYDPEKMYV